MGTKSDIVREYHVEAYVNPPASMIEANEKYISDEFQAFDKDGNVTMDKAAYTGTSQLLLSAFTDFKGVVHDIYEEDGDVILIFHLEGKHTGDFDLTAMGLGVIPASGKWIETEESVSKFMVEGDKIVGAQPISGGFDSFLAALSAEQPSA